MHKIKTGEEIEEDKNNRDEGLLMKLVNCLYMHVGLPAVSNRREMTKDMK